MPDYTTIRIKKTTLEDLEKRRHPGQSWDGIIKELIEEVEKVKEH